MIRNSSCQFGDLFSGFGRQSEKLSRIGACIRRNFTPWQVIKKSILLAYFRYSGKINFCNHDPQLFLFVNHASVPPVCPSTSQKGKQPSHGWERIKTSSTLPLGMVVWFSWNRHVQSNLQGGGTFIKRDNKGAHQKLPRSCFAGMAWNFFTVRGTNSERTLDLQSVILFCLKTRRSTTKAPPVHPFWGLTT